MENYNRGKKIAEDISKQTYSDEVKSWLESNNQSSEVIKNITDESRFDLLYNEFCRETLPEETKRLVQKIDSLRKNRRRRTIIFSTSIAAAIFAISFLLFVEEERPIIEASTKIASNQVEFNSPTLVLDNGKNVNLLSDSDRITISGNQTAKNSGAVLEYENIAIEKSPLNRLVIPKMFTYTLKLSDGTEVFLNANSELLYPIVFNEQSREVFLKGEAFFNVTKSTKPFIVRGDMGSVRVYGTKFNVNLRSSEFISTVLVEGSVGVSVNVKRHHEVIIKPSEMVVMNVHDGSSVVETIDTERYTAWMTGFFRCDTEPLTTLLENISNWFDVSFEYSDASLKNVVVSASVNMNKPLDEILKLVGIISDVKFVKTEQNGYRIETK